MVPDVTMLTAASHWTLLRQSARPDTRWASVFQTNQHQHHEMSRHSSWHSCSAFGILAVLYECFVVFISPSMQELSCTSNCSFPFSLLRSCYVHPADAVDRRSSDLPRVTRDCSSSQSIRRSCTEVRRTIAIILV